MFANCIYHKEKKTHIFMTTRYLQLGAGALLLDVHSSKRWLQGPYKRYSEAINLPRGLLLALKKIYTLLKGQGKDLQSQVFSRKYSKGGEGRGGVFSLCNQGKFHFV